MSERLRGFTTRRCINPRYLYGRNEEAPSPRLAQISRGMNRGINICVVMVLVASTRRQLQQAFHATDEYTKRTSGLFL